MLLKLPLAFVAKLRIDQMNMHQASVSLPFNYLNKNPFRSIYFAALSMAAELSPEYWPWRMWSKVRCPFPCWCSTCGLSL